jgi:predicted aspartyl protease
MGHISTVCRSPAQQASAQNVDAHPITDQEYGYGSLGSIAVEDSDNFQAAADKRGRELPAIIPLETIAIKFTPLNHNVVLNLQVIPDTGAMVTAIPASEAGSLILNRSEVVLRDAAGQVLNMLGTFEAFVELRGNSTTDIVYVVDGLLHPLIGRGLMKELGLLHPNFPYHLKPSQAHRKAHSSGVVQMLAVEAHPHLSHTPSTRKAPFDPSEPTHVSESEYSDDEEEEQPQLRSTLDSVDVSGQVSGLPTPQATKPRPEAAQVC